MEITRVHFEAFKSLYDVTCELSHLTVLTGPNGSGKSNFVDALNFLGEVYADGLEYAVSRAGGYDNIAHRRSRRAKRPIAMSVEVSLGQADVDELAFIGRDLRGLSKGIAFPLLFKHTFAIKTASSSVIADYRVNEDLLELTDFEGQLLLRINRSGAQIEYIDNDRTGFVAAIMRPYGEDQYREILAANAARSNTRLLTEDIGYPNLLWAVRRMISGIKIFQLSPYQVRRAGVPTPNAFLERHGDNLPGAADHLRRNNPKAWGEVVQAMRGVLPGLLGIEVAYTEDRRLALQFRESNLGRPWNTNEVSDGTIQALALFVALFDDRSPMLAIEEPENSIHPWILRRFVDLCSESQRQVLITTHSPVLLNYVNPKIVRLMYLVDGKTEVRRLIDMSPSVGQLVLDGDLSLFDFYDGGLVTETVPRGYAPKDGP